VIKDQLVAAVKAARLTQPRPFETPFGNYPGITVERIVDVVGDILTCLRYVDVELTFCELYPGAESDEERKHLLSVTERLVRNDLDVWKQAGPYVPTVLVQQIRAIDKVRIDPLRPVLLEVLGEALKPDLHGVSSTYKSMTLRQSSTAASDALARMRGQGIDLLMELYRTASSDMEKQRTEAALFEATRTPSNSGYSAGLLACILQNSAIVVDFFAATAPTERYEILQAVERKVLWLHQRNQGIGGAMGADPAVIKARGALDASIRKFREAADANKGYAIYKTLVGFESVFPAAWDDPNFQYQQEAAYREQRIGEFVEQINESNAEEWFAIIQRCAETESNDLATFPVFGQFLQRLSRSKPKIVLGFIDRLGERLKGFLGVMLSGLAQSHQRADLDAKIAEWLAQEKNWWRWRTMSSSPPRSTQRCSGCFRYTPQAP
jgi:hypothetical protein